jgi:hypothetical protein
MYDDEYQDNPNQVTVVLAVSGNREKQTGQGFEPASQ